MRVIYPSVGIRVSYSSILHVYQIRAIFPRSVVLSLYFLPPLPHTSPPSLPSSSPFPPPTLLVFISPPPCVLSNIFSFFFPLFSPDPVLYLIFVLAYSPHSHNHCTYYMDYHPFRCYGLPSKAIKE